MGLSGTPVALPSAMRCERGVWAQSASAWLLFSVVAAHGCGGQLKDPDEDAWISCASDADCAPGQSCQALDPSTRSRSTLPPMPCSNTFRSCASSADCGPGSRCSGSPPTPPNCVAGCIADCSASDSSPCDDGTICRGTSCVPLRCDDAEHPGCPTGMTCEPEGLLDPSNPRPVGGYELVGTDQGSPGAAANGPSPLTERQQKAAQAGCVFLRCDESGAFDCADGYRCDTATAPSITTGCVAVPCQESAPCSTPDFVCDPPNAHPHAGAKDPHGCVLANCDEGHTCPRFTTCNFETPGDGRGCGYVRCDEAGGGCDEGFVCAPEDVNGGFTGCVPIVVEGSAGSSGNGGAAGASGAGASAGAASAIGGLGGTVGSADALAGSGGQHPVPEPTLGVCR